MADRQLVHAYATVNLLRAGAVATIELNRPESLNAWNDQLGVNLPAAIERVASDEEVRAVLLRGTGRAFLSADLRELLNPTAEQRPEVYRVLTKWYNPIIVSVRRMPKPVVAAVHGPTVGIGCSLTLPSDLIIAAETAYFLLAFQYRAHARWRSMRIPGRPCQCSTRCGNRHARRRVPAATTLQWGLINQVVSDTEFTAQSEALVQRLAQGPTRS